MTQEQNQTVTRSTPDMNSGAEAWRESERIITEMLQVTTRHLSLYDTLKQCLDILLKTSWLSIQDKGGIFLVEGDQKSLRLVVDHNLGNDISAQCAKVPFGHCLCGRAAASKTTQYANCIDARHDIRFDGMKPHGHYNVPILIEGETRGVMVFYLPHGYAKNPSEVIFLESAANILSLVIQLKGYETGLEEMVAKRTRQFKKEVKKGKQKDVELHQSENRLSELMELVPEAIVSIDGDGRICLFNRKAESLFGYDKDEIIGAQLEQLLPARSRENHKVMIQNFGQSDNATKMMAQRGEILGLKKDGTEFPARGSISSLRLSGKDRYTALIQDITEQKETERVLQDHIKELRQQDLALKTQNRRFDAAITAMSHGLAMFDGDEKIIIFNERYASIYGLASTQINTGMTLDDIFKLRIKKGCYTDQDTNEYKAEIRKLNESGTDSLAKRILSDGRYVEIRNLPMADGGWLSIHEDVTERHESEKKIRFLANYDTLTGLPNRSNTQAELKKIIQQACEDDAEIALLYIDLDGFKEVNDTLGHPVGDQVLNEIGFRLKKFLSKTIFAGRLSGDEFVMIVTEFDSLSSIEELCMEICAALAVQIHAEHDVIVLSASIGISIGPPANAEVDTYINYADLALYQAKADGGNRYCFFEEEMFTQARERQRMAADLRTAIQKNELLLHYQPQVDLRSGQINGYEALVRWQHSELGMISPFQFIGLAEETGQISEIGEWVLKTACAYAAGWPNKEKVSVNLSPIQFKRQDVGTMVKRALWETGLEPERLELEITESVLIQSTDSVIVTLRTLAEMGISIALDDFGTGFSSLSYLTTFPFNKIKIDKSFIDGLGRDTEVTAIIAMIIGLGRDLGTVITAEGIEDARQHELLCVSGCDQGQGYLYGRPEPRILESDCYDLRQVAASA